MPLVRWGLGIFGPLDGDVEIRTSLEDGLVGELALHDADDTDHDDGDGDEVHVNAGVIMTGIETGRGEEVEEGLEGEEV